MVEEGSLGSGRADPLVDRDARSPNLDVLRALAAMMVLLGHAYALSGRVVISQAAGEIFSARWLIDTLLIFGYSGVWLFFGLSGYLITRPFVRSLISGAALPALLPYATRRIARIYPLYWAALGATVLTFGLASVGERYTPVHLALLQNLIPGQESAALSVAWTLSLELLFYLTVPIGYALLVRLTRGRPMRPSTLASIVGLLWAASIAFGQLAAFTDDPSRQGWLTTVLPATFCMFCPGILLAIAQHDLAGSRWRSWLQELPGRSWAPASAAVCLIAAALLTAGVRPGAAGLDLPFFLIVHLARFLYAIGFGIVISRAIRGGPWGGPVRRPLAELGLISYGIYLIHYVVARALALTDRGRRLIPLPHGGALAYLVHAALLLAITIPLAWVSWHRFERPTLHWAIRRTRAHERTSTISHRSP